MSDIRMTTFSEWSCRTAASCFIMLVIQHRASKRNICCMLLTSPPHIVVYYRSMQGETIERCAVAAAGGVSDIVVGFWDREGTGTSLAIRARAEVPAVGSVSVPTGRCRVGCLPVPSRRRISESCWFKKKPRIQQYSLPCRYSIVSNSPPDNSQDEYFDGK